MLAHHGKQEISSGNTTLICSRDSVWQQKVEEWLMIDVMMVFRSFSLPFNCIAWQSDDCFLRHTQINPASHSLRLSYPHWRIYNWGRILIDMLKPEREAKYRHLIYVRSILTIAQRHDSLEETSALSVKCEWNLGCVCLYRGAASVVGGVRMRLKELCLHLGRACLNKIPYPCFMSCRFILEQRHDSALV